METAVGLLGVALAWSLAGAQWSRARRSPAGISVLSWAVFLAVNATWVVYALGVDNPYLVLNGLGAAAFNVALLRRIDPRPVRTFAAVTALTAVTAAVGITIGWPPVAVWGFVLAAALRWPQILKLAREPDVEGVSLASWLLAAANNGAWIAVGLYRGDLWFTATSVLLGLSSLTVVALILRRRGHRAISVGAGASEEARGGSPPGPGRRAPR